MQRIHIRIYAFVAWAWCRWLLQVIVNILYMACSDKQSYYNNTAWCNLGATWNRRFGTVGRRFGWFFEDCSRSNGQILMVAQKSNITSQGASASVNERSRKNRFGFQFLLQSFFHGEQNVQFAHNLKNLKNIQGILIRINAFVAWAWCRWLLQVIVNT